MKVETHLKIRLDEGLGHLKTLSNVVCNGSARDRLSVGVQAVDEVLKVLGFGRSEWEVICNDPLDQEAALTAGIVRCL